MEVVNAFLTEQRVVPLVTTTVVSSYLITVAQRHPRNRTSSTRVTEFEAVVGPQCLSAARTLERVLDQLGVRPTRTVRSRAGGIAFVFLCGPRYGVLECDDEGAVVAMLSDRSTHDEAETWIVEPDAFTAAASKVRAFLGPESR